MLKKTALGKTLAINRTIAHGRENMYTKIYAGKWKRVKSIELNTIAGNAFVMPQGC